jgi:hypothetical protein
MKKNIVYLLMAFLLLFTGKASVASDLIAIQSAHSGKFVRAGVGQESFLAAASDHIKGWEKFRLIPSN